MTKAPTAADESPESRNREAALEIRRVMLRRITCLSGEDLASADNLRRAGRIFGVLFEGQWHYPKFQLDCRGSPLAEVSLLLEHLSPDDNGWDRLQWLLEANALLGGRLPLEAWEAGDRDAVLRAASQEVWQGRD